VKIAVISDLHANVEAVRAVLNHAESHGAETCVCLGDIVGYHSQVSETISLLQNRKVTCIMGNHDMMATGTLPVEKCGPKAAEAIHWTQGILNTSERDYLGRLEDTIVDNKLLFCHSRLDDPVSHLWRLTEHEIEHHQIVSRYPEVGVCFTGHTHIQKLIQVHNGKTRELHSKTQDLETESFYFINPGSVGYPRRADYRAAYALFDTDQWRVQFFRVRYNRDSLTQANLDNGLRTGTGKGVFSYMANKQLQNVRRIIARIRP